MVRSASDNSCSISRARSVTCVRGACTSTFEVNTSLTTGQLQYGQARKPVGTLLPQRAQYDIDCFGSVRVQSTSARHEGHRNADEAICAPQLGQITAYLSFLDQSLYIHTTLLS